MRHIETTGVILLDLFVIFFSAKLGGEVFLRLKQPPIIGELVAGALIGPYALGLIGHPDSTMVAAFPDEAAAARAIDTVLQVLASLGVIVLLFCVGLETRLDDLVRVGGRALTVAALEVTITLALGFLFMWFVREETLLSASFVAVAMVATSVGITARVLADLGRLDRTEARVILGAALADDVVGLVMLAVVTAAARTGGVSLLEIEAIGLQAAGFIVLVAWVGTHLTKHYSLHLERLHIQNGPFVVAVGVCLALAALSSRIGLAAIVGAYLAGMIFAETREHFQLERVSIAIYELLVPFFFVLTGSRMDWRLFLDPSTLGLAGLVVGLAVIGKVVGSGLGAIGLGWQRAAVVALGMVPRGEVSLVVASTAVATGAASGAMFSALVMMVVATTLITPPALAFLSGRTGRDLD